MAKTTTTNIQFQLSGDGFVASQNLFTSSVANSSGTVPTSVALTTGANTITVPAAAVGIMIVPPPASSNAKTLKGVSGDTGIALAPAGVVSLPFTAGAVSSIVINSAGSETIAVFWQ